MSVDTVCRSPKVCSEDCIYCMLGSSGFIAADRSTLVPTDEFQESLDHLTPEERGITMRFAGTGESTLAGNLGQMIGLARGSGVRSIAVMTNSSLMGRLEVRRELMQADIVVAKMDAGDEDTFQTVNRPHSSIHFGSMLEGLKAFRSGYAGSLRLQVMAMKENEPRTEELAQVCSELGPDLIYLSTPTRPSHAQPLSPRALNEVSRRFQRRGLEVAVQPRERT